MKAIKLIFYAIIENWNEMSWYAYFCSLSEYLLCLKQTILDQLLQLFIIHVMRFPLLNLIVLEVLSILHCEIREYQGREEGWWRENKYLSRHSENCGLLGRGAIDISKADEQMIEWWMIMSYHQPQVNLRMKGMRVGGEGMVGRRGERRKGREEQGREET